jgi:cell division protein FtsZ
MVMAHFELVEKMAPNAVIKVIGVGGGGGNAVAHMVSSSVDGVEFITANTDSQAIKNCGAKLQLQLGGNVTKGLGAGANPEVGRQAALEDREKIMDALQGADMVFITAGMGGGTGTGAAPVVAQLAKEMGVLTVAVVTKPFPFEGRRRMQVALKGIDELSQHCDSLITIPNEKLITVLGRNATMIQAFRAANDVLLGAVQGIADLIVRPGLINVDFADVRTVMSEMGLAMMGTGHARGDDRAQAAAEAAIQNPLLDDVNLAGANGILVNITAGPDFTMAEFDEVGRTVENFASEDATIVIGTVLDPDMQDDVRVTVVATGLNRAVSRQPLRHDERESARDHGRDARRPQVQLIHGKRDGTTGMLIDEVAEPFSPVTGSGGIGSMLRGRGSAGGGTTAEPAAPATADFGNDNSYLDIPAFLRRQAD